MRVGTIDKLSEITLFTTRAAIPITIAHKVKKVILFFVDKKRFIMLFLQIYDLYKIPSVLAVFFDKPSTCTKTEIAFNFK